MTDESTSLSSEATATSTVLAVDTEVLTATPVFVVPTMLNEVGGAGGGTGGTVAPIEDEEDEEDDKREASDDKKIDAEDDLEDKEEADEADRGWSPETYQLAMEWYSRCLMMIGQKYRTTQNLKFQNRAATAMVFLFSSVTGAFSFYSAGGFTQGASTADQSVNTFSINMVQGLSALLTAVVAGTQVSLQQRYEQEKNYFNKFSKLGRQFEQVVMQPARHRPVASVFLREASEQFYKYQSASEMVQEMHQEYHRKNSIGITTPGTGAATTAPHEDPSTCIMPMKPVEGKRARAWARVKSLFRRCTSTAAAPATATDELLRQAEEGRAPLSPTHTVAQLALEPSSGSGSSSSVRSPPPLVLVEPMSPTASFMANTAVNNLENRTGMALPLGETFKATLRTVLQKDHDSRSSSQNTSRAGSKVGTLRGTLPEQRSEDNQHHNEHESVFTISLRPKIPVRVRVAGKTVSATVSQKNKKHV